MMDERNPFTPEDNKPEGIPSEETPPQREAPDSKPRNEGPQNPNSGSYGAPNPWQQSAYGGGYYPPQPPKPPKKPKKVSGWVIGLAALYLLLVGGLFAMIAGGAIRFAQDEPAAEEVGKNEEAKKTEDAVQNAPIQENPDPDSKNPIVSEDYTGNALSASELYEKNVDCVVFVTANYRMGQSNGSGFVIDSENGYILTNYHVVEESEDIAVTLRNGDSYTATFIGGDEINDVAVLKVEAKDLKHVTIANSDDLKVGEDVLIIGNPLGDLTFTLTKGIVSAVNRTINTGEHNITTFQTDTAINSGNSGGPAFDATGAVIGIASAKYASTGVEGIGFCIPINDAMAIARDLVEHGYVTGRPNFGIAVSDSLGYEYGTDEFGRRILVETAKGARVEEVGKDSCASRAGIKVGDIITKLDDTKIENANQLINAKNRHKAGDTVKLEVYRGGETLTFEITLDEYTPD